MYNSLADVFNSSEALYNDPLYEIHNPVESCIEAPTMEDYEYFINHLDCRAYPLPIDKAVHNTVNPLHGKLKPIFIK
jgi:hypothetical protein